MSRSGSSTGFKIWFRDEIENSLVAIHRAYRDGLEVAYHLGGDERALQVYDRGFSAALESVGTALGIERKFPRFSPERE